MHLSSMYYIIFIVAVILASILILFTHWRYKVWQRERVWQSSAGTVQSSSCGQIYGRDLIALLQ